MDVFHMVKSDHKHIEELLGWLVDTESMSALTMLFEELFWELSRHSRAEEETLYPIMYGELRANEQEVLSREQHMGVRSLLQDMRGLSPASPEFRQGVVELQARLVDHFQEEEEFFPFAAKALGGAGVARLTASFREAKTRIMHEELYEDCYDEESWLDLAEDPRRKPKLTTNKSVARFSKKAANRWGAMPTGI